ncbi:protein kinase domain-containing protein [Sphingomonas sp.]|uniref:protein kinase domain-containing protein n=1 Tax=Sphingomonas sp. TaxID=28214 RepID=UPI003B00F761
MKVAEAAFPVQTWVTDDPAAQGAVPVRQVLVKKVANDAEGAVEVGTRLQDGGEAARRVAPHPCVAGVVDVGIDAVRGHYVVSEFVPGRADTPSVAELPRAQTLARALRITHRVAEALVAAAGAAGRPVCHGCIRPSKIMLTSHPWAPADASFDLVKLRDLGLGMLRFRQGEAAWTMATALFIAPELIELTQQPDVRSDIYSLGTVLYLLITGRTPFSGESVDVVHFVKNMNHRGVKTLLEVRKEIDTEHSKSLQPLVDRMMAPRPADRYQTAADLLADLKLVMAGMAVSLDPPKPSDPDPGPTVKPKATPSVWREGPLVVMRRNARLPRQCLKCNQPAEGAPVRQAVFTHPPALYALLLFPVAAVYMAVAALVQTSAVVDVYLCASHRTSRALMVVVAVALIGAGAGVAVLGYLTDLPLLYAVAAVVCLSGPAVGLANCGLLSARRIDAKHLWLSGAGDRFLDHLPDGDAVDATGDAAAGSRTGERVLN